MRKVILTANDFELFDTDISAVEFEFFQKHRDAFRRMWKEQGRQFWISFIMTFRKFAVEFGAIKEFPSQSEQFQDFIDGAFILIHEHFVDVKVNQARSFLLDIVIVAQHKHTIQYLESKSYAKDPFYAKDTRDVFRRLFGAPTEKASYIKVYVLLPVFMKFGGAVCVCLRRWLDAEELREGESYEPIQKEYDPVLGETAARLQQQAFDSYRSEITKGNPHFPMYAPGWPHGRNPRHYDMSNPLYNPTMSDKADWFQDMRAEEYLNFYAYCLSHYAGGKVKIAEEVDKLKEESALKDIEVLADQLELPKHVVEKLTKDSIKNLQRGDLQRSSESFAAYKKELEKGVPRFPMFVPDWPLFKDPRFFDEKNPLYKPTAEPMVDWRTDVEPEQYQKFYNYVVLEYGRRKRDPEFKFSELGKSESKKQKHKKSKSSEEKTLQQEAFSAYDHEVLIGNPCYPTKVPGWPRAVDPRFNDKDNPLYNPSKAKSNADWHADIGPQEFESFYRYVVTNYKDGVKIDKSKQEESSTPEAKSAAAADKSEESPERTQDSGTTVEGKKKKKKNKKKKKAEMTGMLETEKELESDLPCLEEEGSKKLTKLDKQENGGGDAAAKSEKKEKTEQDYKDEFLKQGKLDGKTYINYRKVHNMEHVCKHCSGCRHKHVFHHHLHVKNDGSQPVVTSSGEKHVHVSAPVGAVRVRVETSSAPSVQTSAPALQNTAQNSKQDAPSKTESDKKPKIEIKIVKKENGNKSAVKQDKKENEQKVVKKKEKIELEPEWSTDEDESNRVYIKRETNGHRRADASVWKSIANNDPFDHAKDVARMEGRIFRRDQCPGIRDEWMFDDLLGMKYRINDPARYFYLKQMLLVDEYSCLEKVARVVHTKDDVYSLTLMSVVDEIKEADGFSQIFKANGKRFYLKLQLLESKTDTDMYWVFKAQGTVGEDADHMDTAVFAHKYKDRATAHFKRLFEEATDNRWDDRKNFVRYKKKFFPVDLQMIDAVDAVPKQQSKEAPHQPVLIEEKDGSVILTSTSRKTDESGKVHVTMEKRVISSTQKGGVVERVEETHVQTGRLSLKDNPDSQQLPSNLLDDEDTEIKVVRRENLGTGEEFVGKVHINGPFSAEEKKALQCLEDLDDLTTLIQYTNEVKNMSKNMDKVMRDACKPRPKPKKKAKDSSEKNSQASTEASAGDNPTKSSDVTKSDDVKTGDGEASGASKDKALSEKVEKWDREADVIKECTDTMMPDSAKKMTKEKEEEAIKTLKEIFGLTYDFDDIKAVNVSPPPSPPGSKSSPGQPKDKITFFKLNSAPKELRGSEKSEKSPRESDTKKEPKPTASPAKKSPRETQQKSPRETQQQKSPRQTQQKSPRGAEQKLSKPPKTKTHSADSCVKISPNLTDDTKVDLLRDDTTEKKSKRSAFVLSGNNKADDFDSRFAFVKTTIDGEDYLVPKGMEKKFEKKQGAKPKTTLHFDMRESAGSSLKIDFAKSSLKKADDKKSKAKDEAIGKTKEQVKTEDAGKSSAQSRPLKVCSGCMAVEPKPKTYKKCQKCKEQNIKSARYYCGRDCQVSDWSERHRKEHKDHMLQ